MRTYCVPIRFDSDTSRWVEMGRPVFDGTELVLKGVMGFPGGVRTSAHFELKLDPTTELYVTGEWFTLAFPAVTFNGLRSVRRAGLLIEQPDDTFVEARLNDGSPKWWNGTAWVAAGADDWNDPQDVMEQVGSWAGKTLGVEFRLKTDDETLTPRVGGADFFLAIEHAPSSSDESVGSSWGDDALLRSFAPAVESGLSLWLVDEFDADDQDDGEFTVVDYSKGVGDAPVNVTDVAEAYNLTDDSNRESPLVGVWDPAAKTFTLHDPVESGKRLWTRYRTTPRVVLGGDRDLYTRTFPVLSIEAVREDRARTWTEPSLIVDVVNQVGYQLAAPREIDYVFDLAALARTETEAMEACTAFVEWVGVGRRVRSSATGRYFDLSIRGGASLSPRGEFFECSVSVRMDRIFSWARDEESVSLFVESEVETEVSVRRK